MVICATFMTEGSDSFNFKDWNDMAENTVLDNQLQAHATTLIRRAWDGYDETCGAGFMSCAIYDTAWVSMVVKPSENEKKWLFPQSFDYLIHEQEEDGGWVSAATASSQIDGILNTAASLLSMRRHFLEPLNTTDHALEGLESRIDRATTSLMSQLQRWDVAETAHVGFELIVPALLELLREGDTSPTFTFEGEEVLTQIYNAKMSRFVPRYLYGNQPSTALHSLEAFTGKLEFDRLAHHKIGGSMMGSPSSTAAYLLYTSNWDDEAETYLHNVVRAGAGKGSGAVPSAFPSTFFEYSWILSTLLRSGFSPQDISCPETAEMAKLLARAFELGNGKIGFAPGFPADVDDTAKCIVVLRKLGYEACPAAMIETFEAEAHFRTYASERNPSLTANCNVLSALLAQPDVSRYSTQIRKIVDFICDTWWQSGNGIKDKWNLSPLYSSLLVVQTFVDLLILIEKKNLDLIDQDTLSQVHITIFQACLRALLQDAEAQSVEQISYRVLILCEARRLPYFDAMSSPIDDCVEEQVARLISMDQDELDSKNNRIWVEKVSYGSEVLTQSYRLGALRAASQPADKLTLDPSRHPVSTVGSGSKYVRLLKQTPLFASTPEWQVQASMLEASLFQPLLLGRRLDVFPRKNMAPDKYFDLIPLTWTSCNNRVGTFASTNFIYEMMVISFLDFQADEFMEAVAGPAFAGRMHSLRQLIDGIFMDIGHDLPNTPVSTNGANGGVHVETNGLNHKTNGNGLETNGHRDEVHAPLRRFISHVLYHPSTQVASSWDRNSTLRELRNYLHAHVTQYEDSARIAKAQTNSPQADQETPPSPTATEAVGSDSYFRWIRTTSGDHTACPYSFGFARCLLSREMGGVESFPTAKSKYLAAAACQHLAAMCRMYNDYGSIARDAAECNLNSVDFAEFNSETRLLKNISNGDKGENGNGTNGHSLEAKKMALYELAQYERSWLNDSMGRLKVEMQGLGRSREMEVVTMFADVTDLYGQIYVVKDLASRMA